MALATFDQHEILKAVHPILTVIASCRSAHINRLTPRTLDISSIQLAMKAVGLDPEQTDVITADTFEECPETWFELLNQ